MRSPSTRTRKLLVVAAGPLAVIAAGAMVLQGSYAAFEAETRNAGNSWSTGAVNLTDDDSGTARFQVTNLIPGQTDTKCIKVTSTATVPGVVKLYFINPSPGTPASTAVENYITLKVEEGDVGDFASCDSFVASPVDPIFNDTLYHAAVSHGSWDNALGAWSVTAGVKTYKFTWTFSATPPQSVQGTHFGVDFEWEMQNS